MVDSSLEFSILTPGKVGTVIICNHCPVDDEDDCLSFSQREGCGDGNFSNLYLPPSHSLPFAVSLSLCIAIIKSIDKVFPAAPSTDKINSISSRDNQLLFHNLSSHANCTFDAAICDYLSGIIIPFAGRRGHAPFSLCMAVNQPASQLLAPPAGSPV